MRCEYLDGTGYECDQPAVAYVRRGLARRWPGCGSNKVELACQEHTEFSLLYDQGLGARVIMWGNE